jgi:hypothetical protein
MEEALAPQADHIASDRERGGDRVVAVSIGGEEDHLGAQHFEIWQRIFADAALQNPTFGSRQANRKGTVSGHLRQASFCEG